MAADHPDRELVNFIVEGFTNGFSLGLTSKPKPRKPCDNLKGVLDNPEEAQRLVDSEIEKGHMLGQSDKQPLEEMNFSPINLVHKAGTKDEFHLIHDLSHPYDGINAVSNHIPDENAKVKYRHIDEVIDLGFKLRVKTNASCMDIRHAFRNLPLREDQLFLTGFTLNGKLYINSSLPFGASSSCFIFEKVATLVEWIVKHETKNKKLSHYLDDFPLLEKNWQETKTLTDQFIKIVQKIGLPIAENKTIRPTQFLIYLGLLLNFRDQVLAIPNEKKQDCIELIDELVVAYRNRQTVRVQSIQKLAGHLNFICQAIPVGRVFLGSLYALTALTHGEKVRPGHHRRLNKALHDDLGMFRKFLAKTNEFNRTIPFMIRQEIDASSIEFYADSAGSKNLGFGCICGTQWAQAKWSETNIFQEALPYTPKIALLELLVIVIAFDIWAPRVSVSTVILRSDNEATVHWLNSKKADIPIAKKLIRHLTYQCLSFQIYIRAVHVKGILNRKSDLLSCYRMAEFRFQFPEMDRNPQKLPSIWPQHWTHQEMFSQKENAKSQSSKKKQKKN